jgi:hypothetical protein
MSVDMERLRADAKLRGPAEQAKAFPFTMATLAAFHDTWNPDACIAALDRIRSLEDQLETALAIINLAADREP